MTIYVKTKMFNSQQSRCAFPNWRILNMTPWFEPVLPKVNFFRCLLGFNIAFKPLTSYRVSTCLQQWFFDQCAAAQECHATDTGHDTRPCHSIQSQGRPVAVLSIDMERHTGIHNYHFNVLGQTRSGNPSLTFHTHPSEAYYAARVVVSQKLGRKCTVTAGVCESITLSPRPQVNFKIKYFSQDIVFFKLKYILSMTYMITFLKNT